MSEQETKNCPYCGEEILAVAKKCKHCGEWLDGIDAALTDEAQEKPHESNTQVVDILDGKSSLQKQEGKVDEYTSKRRSTGDFRNKKPPVLAIIGVVMIMVGLIIIPLLLSGKSKSSKDPGNDNGWVVESWPEGNNNVDYSDFEESANVSIPSSWIWIGSYDGTDFYYENEDASSVIVSVDGSSTNSSAVEGDDFWCLAIMDHATIGKKVYLICDSGGIGSMTVYFVVYFDMSTMTFHYLDADRYAEFNSEKTKAYLSYRDKYITLN